MWVYTLVSKFQVGLHRSNRPVIALQNSNFEGKLNGLNGRIESDSMCKDFVGEVVRVAFENVTPLCDPLHGTLLRM
jgi:hypothetical protein